MGDELIESGVHLLTLLDAKREESRMVKYVAKGRLYQSLSEIQLGEKYEKIVKLFSDDVLNKLIREAYDDFCCEYSIRNITPPDKKIWHYWKKIMEAAKSIIEDMSDEDKERINREMMDDARATAGRKS